MSEPLTAEEAIDQLRRSPQQYATPEDLRRLAAQVNADASGKLTVLYSGPAANSIWSTDVINGMVEAGEDVRVINNSQASKFLTSRDFYQALAKAYDLDDFRPLADGSYRGPATDWLYHPTQGPWADASARFADATKGEVRAIVADANPTRVFGAVEVPHILANPNVTIVEGIPREALAGVSERSGQQAAFELIVARSRDHVAELRVPVSNDAMRNENRVLRLDSRDYLAETSIEGKQPAFTEPTHKLAERMNPPTEHVQAGQTRWNEWHAIGADAAPERAGPRLSRAGTAAGLAGIGIAAAAYDAKETGDRISTAFAQDNPVAARSEATQFVARGVGGAAAGLTPVALGVSGGPAVALAVADAYLLTKGFERLAERMDLSKIINQTDRESVAWELNGRQWLRKDLEADLRGDGVNKPLDQDFAAPPSKVRELNYLASMEATGQAIGKASPQNPFVQPSSDSDPGHLYSRHWTRSAETGEWSRMVADEVSKNDAPLWKPETASPTRAADLDRQATRVIDSNIADGPAPIAARYEAAHRRNGWDNFGPEPDAVCTALNPDTLQASNGDQYVRNAQGQWSHGGEVAQGNLALELETTRERLIPALSQHEAQLAKMPAWQAPTPEQQDRENLRQMYTDFRVDPTPEQFEATYQAVQRTRKVEGIDPATSSLGLEPRPNNDYSITTPIQHLRFDSQGVVRVAATTTVDIVPSKEAALSGAPHAVDAPTAQEREGQAQAQREANRLGLSQDETQAAVRVAAPAISASGGRSGKADDQDQELLKEAPPKRNGQEGPTTTASVPPDFAPSQRGPRDIRDPQHEGNEAHREMQHKVKAFEAQQGIAHGPHSDRMAASMLVFSVEKGLHYSEVSLEKNQDTGQVQLKHAKFGEPVQRFDVDPGKMSSQPIEASSQRINEAVSKHYGAPLPSLERTREQAQGLGDLSFDDKVMFARIRSGTPGHITDDHVAQAMVAAKKNGMDANSVGQVSMVGDQIRVAEAGPAGRTALVDVNSPAPPLQSSVKEANEVNQQQVLTQQQAMTQQQKQQDGQSGPTMGARSM
jgi:hypothetical protein